jgi:phenylpropionate dioxygenase-like ring-hydroxylating dioxygenase large terminal subunit
MYRYPFTPYPNGWYRVALSRDLARGKIVNLRYFGRDLVAFRGDDGVAHVLDAHCPHLGAHVGRGGKVVGNTVQCPMHAWRFAGNGDCVDVPYCKKIPPLARMRSWPSTEVNGMVLVWFHAEGAAPTFSIPTLPEYGAPSWSSYLTLGWKPRVHVQEVAENALDLPHFNVVHDYLQIPALDHFETTDHTFRVKIAAPRRVFGIMSYASIDITYHGMGVVFATVVSKQVELRVILTSTPIDDEHVAIDMAVLHDLRRNPLRNAVIRAVLPLQIGIEFEHDIPIWEHKAYHSRPVLCATDGPIMAIRKWCEQFYSPAEATAQPAIPQRALLRRRAAAAE